MNVRQYYRPGELQVFNFGDYTFDRVYSFRRLISTYSGYCCRVRRSSDNSETDIGFTGDVIDTSSLLSFVGAGDGFVTIWYDQSGNSNAVQALAANQAYIVRSGSVVLLNGKPTLDFDGASNKFYSFASGNFIGKFLYVYFYSPSDSIQQLLSGGVVNTQFRCQLATLKIIRVASSTEDLGNPSISSLYSSAGIVQLRTVSASEAQLYWNEDEKLSPGFNPTSHSNTTFTLSRIGNRGASIEPFQGYMSEIVIGQYSITDKRIPLVTNVKNYYTP